MVEELVKLLIRVVDAELLERVRLEVLETEDVEDPDKLRRVLSGVGALVDVIDEPSKRPRVERLRHGVPVLPSLIVLERDLGDVAADVDLPQKEHLADADGLLVETEQRSDRVDDGLVIVRQVRRFVIGILK